MRLIATYKLQYPDSGESLKEETRRGRKKVINFGYNETGPCLEKNYAYIGYAVSAAAAAGVLSSAYYYRCWQCVLFWI
jgi:hypothetical protein